MICLAYLSSSTLPIDAATLSDILAKSQRNNTANNITGLLCHHDGSFLQFLEGAAEDVEPTFQRICADSRHRGMIEVYREAVSERAFGAWSMGVARLDKMDEAERAFCTSLRSVELSASAAHREALEPFLQTFRAWLR